MEKYSRSNMTSTSPIVIIEKMSGDREGQLRKLSSDSRISDKVLAWFKNNPLDFDNNVYSLVVPLGATESWGCTVNGDGFERKWLAPVSDKYGHHTFTIRARAYLHHKNQDPSIGFGDNPVMDWNPEMDRCEGVWRLWREKADSVGAKYLLDKIENGKEVQISMGASVPYDVCTLCGNKAKTPANYCGHNLRPGFGNIDPVTGELMQVLNPHPDFFDLSAVLIGAAPEAVVLGHIGPNVLDLLGVPRSGVKTSSANSGGIVLVDMGVMADLAANGGITTKTSGITALLKSSDMIKIIPAMSHVVRPRLAPGLLPRFSVSRLRGMKMAGASLSGLLSSAAAIGLPLCRDDFRRALGVFGDSPSLADDRSWVSSAEDKLAWQNQKERLVRFYPDAISDTIVHDLDEDARASGILMPDLEKRIRGEAPAVRVDVSLSTTSADPALAAFVARAYNFYLEEFAKDMPKLLSEFSKQRPHSLVKRMQGFSGGPVMGMDEESSAKARALAPGIHLAALSGQDRGHDVVMNALMRLSADPTVSPLITGALIQ